MRDANWAAPEQTFNMNVKALGNLQLSDENEADLVAFLGTLTDGYSLR